MIGLDTNVLVRFLVRDDAATAERVERAIREHCSQEQPGFINHIVLCELAWVLERAYNYRRADVAALLDALCRATDLRIEQAEIVSSTIRSFATGSADFAACLSVVVNRASGCKTTLTSDR